VIKRLTTTLIVLLAAGLLAACGGAETAPAGTIPVATIAGGETNPALPTVAVDTTVSVGTTAPVVEDVSAALDELQAMRQAARDAAGLVDDFSVEIGGAVTRTVAGSGAFRCEDPRRVETGETAVDLPGGQTISVLGDGLEVVTLGMPVGTGAGTYDLRPRDETGSVLWLEVTLDGLTYSAVQTGTLTLEAAPSGPDQPARGSFEALVGRPDSAESLIVRGHFDFVTLGQAAAATGADLSEWYCE